VSGVAPLMPNIVHEVGLTAADYGIVVAAFGAAKLVANVPCAAIADSYGRRAAIVGGLTLVAAGYATLPLSESMLGMAASRAVTGLGATGFVAGCTLVAADISTPLSRGATTAPLGAAFNTGAIAGPAVGGAFAAIAGPTGCLEMCALSVLGVAGYAARQIPETRTGALLEAGASPQFGAAARVMVAKLSKMAVRRPLQRLGVANWAYWVSLAGVNMTVMPLKLASPDGLALPPATIGALFAMQAAISVVAALPVGALADRIGPERMIAPSLCALGCSNALLPLAHDITSAAGVMAIAALANTVCGGQPTAAAANASEPQDRASALALLRTAGDVGLLCGSASIGAVASIYGIDAALYSAGGVLIGSGALFTQLSRSEGAARAAAAVASSKGVGR